MRSRWFDLSFDVNQIDFGINLTNSLVSLRFKNTPKFHIYYKVNNKRKWYPGNKYLRAPFFDLYNKCFSLLYFLMDCAPGVLIENALYDFACSVYDDSN